MGYLGEILTCTAFPDGIPDEILHLGFDHRQAFEGDNGVRFTPYGLMDVAEIEEVLEGARLFVERFG